MWLADCFLGSTPMSDKPAPLYSVGQRVRVVLNEKNKTPHEGTIRVIIWHHKDQRYNYYLEENGRKVSKRYFDEDLLPFQ
jgi:hypothetical protein